MFKAKKIRQKNYFIIYRYMKNKNELITISNTFQVFSKTSIVQLTYNMCYRPFVVVLKKKAASHYLQSVLVLFFVFE